MKVLMPKGFLATGSYTSQPCLSIRALAGTRLTSLPVMPGGPDRRHHGQTFFRFTYFHGPSAARPLGWPLRMTNGKVKYLRLSVYFYIKLPATLTGFFKKLSPRLWTLSILMGGEDETCKILVRGCNVLIWLELL